MSSVSFGNFQLLLGVFNMTVSSFVSHRLTMTFLQNVLYSTIFLCLMLYCNAFQFLSVSYSALQYLKCLPVFSAVFQCHSMFYSAINCLLMSYGVFRYLKACIDFQRVPMYFVKIFSDTFLQCLPVYAAVFKYIHVSYCLSSGICQCLSVSSSLFYVYPDVLKCVPMILHCYIFLVSSIVVCCLTVFCGILQWLPLSSKFFLWLHVFNNIFQ